MSAGVTVSPAAPAEQAAALRRAFAHLDPEARLARVAVGLDLLARGDLDPAGVLVARAGGAVVGAMVAAPVPGAGAAVWPPAADDPAAADALVRHAADWLRGRGVKLAQALLAPEETGLAGPLLRGGFAHATTLHYLRHYLELPTDLFAGPERLTYTPFAAADPAAFAAALGRTYEGTADCPEVSGARTPAEALAGHQSGGFDPDRWWLADAAGERVGVLLVNTAPADEGWEVAYVGVVPEHRRRGHGRELMAKALWEAKAAGQPFLALAVDERNRPARALYRRLGFEPYERREVLLAVWDGGSALAGG